MIYQADSDWVSASFKMLAVICKPQVFKVLLKPTQQNCKVARVCDGGEEKRSEALIKFEGKVGGAGDQRR